MSRRIRQAGAIPSSSENGSEFDRPKESGKLEELPRAGKRSEDCGSDGVRRLFENSTVCLIVNANYLTLLFRIVLLDG
ncbi:hypothetical protein, partial [Promicromonospora sp. NPDC050880]|uniref:hypothetical protein n=1 Tax=Promicromonospora sp. NPDC050880 TaxID=3364406 RepID=UPI0037A18CF2